MRVFNDIDNINIKRPVITIGAFDGVHKGHKKLLNKLISDSQELGGESVVLTFMSHPRRVLNPEFNIALLQSNQEKSEMLSSIGIDNLIFLDFNKNISQMSARQFIENILVKKLGMFKLLVGFNHLFGSDKIGDFLLIKQYATEYGFLCEKVDGERGDNEFISSSKIREMINEGHIETANKLLDYKYSIYGTVVHGNKIGRQIDFPTINLQMTTPKLLPKQGVYAVELLYKQTLYFGMLNIGSRPTIDLSDEKIYIEVHLFNFEDEIYEETVKISFIKRFREEIKFASLDALQQQLYKDKEVIIKYLKDKALITFVNQ